MTFRLADSLPQKVWDELETERELWLKNHGIDLDGDHDWKAAFRNLPKSEQREFERESGFRLNEHLDREYGSCCLGDRNISRMVADGLTFFHDTRVRTGDYVVMPNHVHVLMTPLAGCELEDILHSVKSYTANRINETRGQCGMFWQKESYDHIVRDSGQLERFQKYIRNNPAKAGLEEGLYRLSEEAVYRIV